jgi:hypothetical protein
VSHDIILIQKASFSFALVLLPAVWSSKLFFLSSRCVLTLCFLVKTWKIFERRMQIKSENNVFLLIVHGLLVAWVDAWKDQKGDRHIQKKYC